jgi:integrase
VDLPKYETDTTGLAYTLEESRALLSPHPGVDWRVTLAANIAADTGRRLKAIRHLWVGREGEETPSDIAELEFEVDRETLERMWLRFQKEFDKRKRTAIRPVHPETRALIEEAMERTQVVESGWLFTEGRMEYQDARDKPIGGSALIRMLHQAEQALGVPTVKGRGFHGLKRRHITVGYEVSGGDEALVGDVTGNVDWDLIR